MVLGCSGPETSVACLQPATLWKVLVSICPEVYHADRGQQYRARLYRGLYLLQPAGVQGDLFLVLLLTLPGLARAGREGERTNGDGAE